MKCWFSCNHRCRRSRYEEDHRLSEIREEGKREKGKQEGGPKEAAVGEGCPRRGTPRAEPQPDGAVEDGDDPESPAKALQALGTLPSEEAAGEAPPPSSQPAPSFPIPHQEILGFIQELGAAQERQSRHRRERKKDLRSCHNCLKSVKTLKESLQEVQGRLWRVEAKLGIRVPPHELDLELEEDEKEPPKEGGEGEESPPTWAPLPAPPPSLEEESPPPWAPLPAPPPSLEEESPPPWAPLPAPPPSLEEESPPPWAPLPAPPPSLEEESPPPWAPLPAPPPSLEEESPPPWAPLPAAPPILELEQSSRQEAGEDAQPEAEAGGPTPPFHQPDGAP